MDRKTEHIVRFRGGGVCEYCRLPEVVSHVQFPLDHIVARQHRGPSTEDNLAVACPDCNAHKGTNLASIDEDTGELVRLYNPRRDNWTEHFRWDGPTLVGRTPVSKVTARLLRINAPPRLELRRMLMQMGLYPAEPGGPGKTGGIES